MELKWRGIWTYATRHAAPMRCSDPRAWALPPIKGYWRLGAVVDRTFGATDLFVAPPIEHVKPPCLA
jgi:hypothetical protein